MSIIGTVEQVRVGGIEPLGENAASAIDKKPVNGKVELFKTHLAGDSVADNRHHGGIDKAIHCYAAAHYASWKNLLGDNAYFKMGGFGENLCIIGTDETQVYLGDVWQIGSTQLQISQPRQPCWKLNIRFGIDNMAYLTQSSGLCGWYARVLQTGHIQAGDKIILLSRNYPEWSIARLLHILHNQNCETDLMHSILKLPLPASWLQLFQRRLQTGVCENWGKRLQG